MLPFIRMSNSITKHVSDLVQRSRLGDQVATAAIAVISTRAKKGDKRAAKVRGEIIRYAKKNPMPAALVSPTFGIERQEPAEVEHIGRRLWRNLHTGKYSGAGVSVLVLSLGNCAPHLLADSPNLKVVIDDVRSAFAGEECRNAYNLGMQKSSDPMYLSVIVPNFPEPEQKALQLGYLIGKARRIQAIRSPAIPVSMFARDTGWEFGE